MTPSLLQHRTQHMGCMLHNVLYAPIIFEEIVKSRKNCRTGVSRYPELFEKTGFPFSRLCRNTKICVFCPSEQREESNYYSMVKTIDSSADASE